MLVFVGVACISFTVMCVYTQISELLGLMLGLTGVQYLRAVWCWFTLEMYILVHNGLSESGCVCASFSCGWWIYVGGRSKFTMIYETFKKVFVSV